MLIGRQELCSLIPHAGSMCLLEAVVSWDAHQIHCVSNSHLDPENPLRRDGRLACVHLLEYGAQAMAVHGGLLARRNAGGVTPGLLASLRDVSLQPGYVDESTAPLEIHAQKITATGNGFMYRFQVRGNERILASAQAMVVTQAGAQA